MLTGHGTALITHTPVFKLKRVVGRLARHTCSTFRSVQSVQTNLCTCPVGDDYEKCSAKSQSMLVFITILLFAAFPLRLLMG